MRLHRLALAALLLAGPCTGWAHTVPAPGPLAPVRSMGMPPTWKPFTGDYCAVDRRDDDNRTAGAAFVGI